jgi:hypothetical protein
MPPRKVTQGCVLGNLNDPNSLITQAADVAGAQKSWTTYQEGKRRGKTK